MIDVREIMKIMPHRYPFLLVDRIETLKEGEEIVGIKNVSINEPFFVGHFPDNPIMPGVLIVEAMAQVGGILAFHSSPKEWAGSLVYFMGIDKVRFRKPVVPGDQLVIDVDVIHSREKALKIAATATVDQQLVAQAELLAAVGERK